MHGHGGICACDIYPVSARASGYTTPADTVSAVSVGAAAPAADRWTDIIVLVILGALLLGVAEL